MDKTCFDGLSVKFFKTEDGQLGVFIKELPEVYAHSAWGTSDALGMLSEKLQLKKQELVAEGKSLPIPQPEDPVEDILSEELAGANWF